MTIRSRFLCPLLLLSWMLFSLLAVAQKNSNASESISIPKTVLLDKIKGGWVGQTIGVTYGWPTEFVYQGTFIQDYESISWNADYVNQAMVAFPGLYDDIYVDLTFMEVYDRVGLDAPVDSFAHAFARTEYELWHANQVARYNLRNGVPPARAGHWLNNPHADDIDFQIEADFAGLISPAMPQAASAICSTTGTMIASGDGYYGGLFVANMYAQAFHRKDLETVILEALAAIPPESDFFKCIADVIKWHREYPGDWKQTWWMIQQVWAEDIGCPNFVFHPINIDAKVNAAYVVMALLYGEGDFFRTMDIATRAGQDSDCNPATACGVLGTMIGYEQIPAEYLDPLKRAEDKKFSHSAYSLQDVYQLNLKLAYANIEKHGGKITASEVHIPLQKTPVAAMEKNFAGHFPAERVKVARSTGGSFGFNFDGRGMVLSGYVTRNEAGLPDTSLQAELYVDGRLMETANLYTHSIDRRPELFWCFKLPDGNHRIEVKLLSDDQRYGLYIADYLVYRSPTTHLKEVK
jgi:hypothetical protein